ncbi:hypothetical protein ACTFIZ_000030 [Dictyostelium cf. discoideum]
MSINTYQSEYQKPLIQESSSTYFYPLQPNTYDINKDRHQYPNGIKPIVVKVSTHPNGTQEKKIQQPISNNQNIKQPLFIEVQEKYKNDYNYSITFLILGSPICKVRKFAFISLLVATAYIVLPYIVWIVYVVASIRNL